MKISTIKLSIFISLLFILLLLTRHTVAEQESEPVEDMSMSEFYNLPLAELLKIKVITGTRSKARKGGKKRKGNKKRGPSKKRNSVAGKGKKSFIDKIPILKNKTVQKIGFGLGMGTVAIGIIDLLARFGPPASTAPLVTNKRIIKLGVEALTEPLSAGADILLTGGLNLGGSNGSNTGANGGFA